MTNLSHIIETALLLLVAYLFGCVIGYALRRLTSSRPKPVIAVDTAPEIAPAAKGTDVPPPVAIVAAAAEPVPTPLPKELTPAARLAKTSPPELEAPKPVAPIVPPEPLAEPEPTTEPPASAPVELAKIAAETTPKKSAPPKSPKPKPSKPKRADPKPAGLAAPRKSGKDDLRQIKGIGPKIETTLNGLGIFHYDQLAKLTPANVVWIDTHLGFKGRVAREAWIEQAKALAKPRSPKT